MKWIPLFFFAASLFGGDVVQISKEPSGLKATVDGKDVLWYQAEPGPLPRPDIREVFKRGGYIHPLRTLSGKLVTDDFPRNHVHHHGVWWAWTKTEFQGRQPDFWNMGEGKGRGEYVAVEMLKDGFRSRHRFVDLTGPLPTPAVNDTWEVRIHPAKAADKFWMFDLISVQTTAGSHPLKLPKYHYGGLGFRGNWNWNGKTNCFFLTSSGETNRDKGNFTNGKWCDMSGLVDGAMAGVTILGHPDNFRAPQPMRIHPEEPFFCFAPQQSGDMEIAPEKPYISRYRFVVHDGPPDKKVIDGLWSEFAKDRATVGR